jgi:RNA-directed DNA polymerase
MPALLDQMSEDMQMPQSLIRGTAKKASFAYKEYTIPKRDGSRRTIHHPSQQLKSLHRWLLAKIVGYWPVHEAAAAYRVGKGIRENAVVHASSRYLLRMDFANFFPSITSADVESYLATRPTGTEVWDGADRKLFSDLVCRNGVLTIGAPTSPALSNALCIELDAKLAGLAYSKEVRFTRYADDLFFSTKKRDVLGIVENEIKNVVLTVKLPGGLTINPDKTRHSSKRGRRQVTGLVITPQGDVSIGRKRKRYIWRQVHRLQSLTSIERRKLAGLIAFATSVNSDIVNRLVMKYGPAAVDRARSGN